MKAAVLERDPSGRGVFRIDEGLPRPRPAAGEIVLRVAAASINPIETLMRDGYGDGLFRWLRDRGPCVLGLDGAGVVAEASEEVRELREGDAVMAATWPYKAGFYAEYVRVPASFVVLVPRGMRLGEAAGLPYAGLTGCAVLSAASLAPETARGRRVLVHGGSGGVGSILVQVLHRWGAWVATTCGSGNVERVRQLGADRVIDYRSEDFRAVLDAMDVVVNTVPPPAGARGLDEAPHLSVLRAGGTYVSVISPMLTLADKLGAPVGLLLSAAWMGAARAYWLAQGKHHRWVYFEPSPRRLRSLAAWVESGALQPLIGARYALAEIEQAHARLEQGGVGGKVLLVVDPELAEVRA